VVVLLHLVFQGARERESTTTRSSERGTFLAVVVVAFVRRVVDQIFCARDIFDMFAVGRPRWFGCLRRCLVVAVAVVVVVEPQLVA